MASMASMSILLEAEVAPGSQAKFEERYLAATGVTVSPGAPVYYQSQANKWGPELRVYFNDIELARSLMARGLNVEEGRDGYRSGEYRFRVNNNEYWWSLVEIDGLRLGPN